MIQFLLLSVARGDLGFLHGRFGVPQEFLCSVGDAYPLLVVSRQNCLLHGTGSILN